MKTSKVLIQFLLFIVLLLLISKNSHAQTTSASMVIDTAFAKSAKDSAVTNRIFSYITVRYKIPKCDCVGRSSECNLHACMPNGGVYTKLDKNSKLNFDSLALIKTKLDSLSQLIYKEIIEIKKHIEKPSIPDIRDYYDDIDRLAIVLIELNYYVVKIKIDLLK